MKNKITIDERNGQLSFYLQDGKTMHYLFSEKFSRGVYEFFKSGRSENEVKRFRKWNKDRRLDKTIEKIPEYINYVLQGEAV